MSAFFVTPRAAGMILAGGMVISLMGVCLYQSWRKRMRQEEAKESSAAKAIMREEVVSEKQSILTGRSLAMQ